jgi:hypothetical protein
VISALKISVNSDRSFFSLYSRPLCFNFSLISTFVNLFNPIPETKR